MKSEREQKRVLLISNSTLYGSGYLDHAESEIRSFLGTVNRVLFIPYALYDRDAYASLARERFERMGYGLASIHAAADAKQGVNEAEAVFIGIRTRSRWWPTVWAAHCISVARPYRGNEMAPRRGSSVRVVFAGARRHVESTVIG